MIICLDYDRLCYSPAKHSESAELAYFFAFPQAFRPIVSKLFFFSRYFALITWLNGICFHGPTYTSIALLIEQRVSIRKQKKSKRQYKTITGSLNYVQLRALLGIIQAANILATFPKLSPLLVIKALWPCMKWQPLRFDARVDINFSYSLQNVSSFYTFLREFE